MVVGDAVVGASSVVVLVGSGGRAVVDTALVGVVKIFNNRIINYVSLND